MTVTGTGSSWIMSGQLFVGSVGNGTLEILAGGAVISDGSTIGDSTGSNGQATVDGAGSLWTNTDILTIGNDNGTIGSLTLRNGGTVIATTCSSASLPARPAR